MATVLPSIRMQHGGNVERLDQSNYTRLTMKVAASSPMEQVPAGRPARYFPHRHTDRSLHQTDAMDAPCDAGNSTHIHYDSPSFRGIKICAMTRYRVQMAVFWDAGKRTYVSTKQPPAAILNGQAAGRCHAFTNPHGVTSLNNVIFAQLPQ